MEKFYDTLEAMGVEIVEDFEEIPLEDISFDLAPGDDEEAEAPAVKRCHRRPGQGLSERKSAGCPAFPEEEIDLAIRITEG